MTFTELESLAPCTQGLDFALGHPTPQAAWKACTTYEWMVWLLRATQHPALPQVALACARAALPVFETACPGDLRPRIALDATAARCRGARAGKVLSDCNAAFDLTVFGSAEYFAALAAYGVSFANLLDHRKYLYSQSSSYSQRAEKKLKIPQIIRSIVPTI